MSDTSTSGAAIERLVSALRAFVESHKAPPDGFGWRRPCYCPLCRKGRQAIGCGRQRLRWLAREANRPHRRVGSAPPDPVHDRNGREAIWQRIKDLSTYRCEVAKRMRKRFGYCDTTLYRYLDGTGNPSAKYLLDLIALLTEMEQEARTKKKNEPPDFVTLDSGGTIE